MVLTVTPAGADLLERRRDARAAAAGTALAELPADDADRITAALPALAHLADALRRSPTSRR